MTEVRALTVRQPWAWAIAAAGKDVENRTWRTGYRGLIAIHAAKRADDPSQLPADVARAYAPADPAAALGVIVAVARLIGCDQCRAECSRWAIDGQWHWHLAQVRALAEPVPIARRLGLWPLPPPLARQITAEAMR